MRSTNRQNLRVFTLAAATETELLGADSDATGMILNGASHAVIALINIGAGDIETVTIYVQATPTGTWRPNATTYVILAGASRRIDLADLTGFAIRVTGTSAAGTDCQCEAELQAG